MLNISLDRTVPVTELLDDRLLLMSLKVDTECQSQNMFALLEVTIPNFKSLKPNYR